MNKQVEAKKNWEKKNIRLYSFSCNRTYDADIIEFMEQKENKYGYLRSLIRRDMEKRKISKKPHWVSLTPPSWFERNEVPITADTRMMCSVCKNAVFFVAHDLPYDFCPHCKADMRGGRE